MGKYRVYQAGQNALHIIVSLHLQVFEGYFLSRLGKAVLERFYLEMLKSGGVCFVAENKRGEACGFIIAVPSAFKLYVRFLARNFFMLGWAVFRGVLSGRVKTGEVLERFYIVPFSMLREIFLPRRVRKSAFSHVSLHYEIMSLAVSGEDRNKGVGKMLLNEMIKWAQKKGNLTVGVSCRKDNKVALEFYKKYGFVQESKKGEVIHLILRFD